MTRFMRIKIKKMTRLSALSTALLFGAHQADARRVLCAGTGLSGGRSDCRQIGILFWTARGIAWHLLMRVSRLDIGNGETCLQILP